MKVPKVTEVREEYRTGLVRGIGGAVLASALVFFTQWPLDTGTQALISATVVAGLVPLGTFFGFGVKDARMNDQG